MVFKSPVRAGETVRFEGRVIQAGRTSLLTQIEMSVKGKLILEGRITFVNVDENGKAFPHGIQIK